ncbi:ferrous iron transport protein B [Flaviflexus equikiangi]|uniref:Ferrous iron transport protein B n=1 Tax=Flaviflexus equikiangi TaxID=2758573 RepID=A0ABS2TH48_9ACTO|nr:ferrous iron transport protein B [Flaviflexus equikiangi]MBM9433642.1 ferrous iron transport protein B [Flaviflexus equikiangi]
MTCSHCGPSSGAPTLVGSPRILLVGNPNVGKSTLFNRLTGARQDIRNAPGTTVDLSTGGWRSFGSQLTVVDSPGTYSLLARSADEQVVTELLTGDIQVEGGKPDLVVAVLDATALSRSLYLLGQLSRVGLPVIVALSMVDVARAEGVEIDTETMSSVLGVPVVAIDPRHGLGLEDLAGAVRTGLDVLPFLIGPDAKACTCAEGGDCCGSTQAADATTLAELLEDADDVFAWVEVVSSRLGAKRPRIDTTFSDRVDRVLLNPVAGILILLGVLWGLFQLTTSVAAPVMEWAEGFVGGPVTDWALALTGALGLSDTWVESLLIDGILAGIGVVLSFVPLMFIMFFALALLEDSGYLARAALLADRLMRSIGLDGRAVLPLIVGFGCNLPALAATKTLPNAAHRTVTALLVPLTSCAARLTVYILIAATFFPSHAGTVVFAMYIGSVLLVIAGGLLLKLVFSDDTSADPLFLVLPAYQKPGVTTVFLSAARRALAFLKGAGVTIVVMLTIMWGLMAIPVTGDHDLADVPVEDSLYAEVAQTIAPVFAPAGFNDWHASAALLTGIVAKETVVAALSQSYQVDEPEENSYEDAEGSDLGERLRADFDDASGGHGQAAALAFLVFVLAYTPCVATLAEQKRILGWRITAGAFGAQLVLAWLLAVAVFQIGSLL